ncbi:MULTISPECIES: hypothetical protein [Rhodococcus]|nr:MULTISPECIES: hypothetical protein [Rhodococcus]USC14722.1 hypothetical protein KZJ41_24445 [Rhodococcus sp. 11-3]WKW98069.1 hypothetical protein Q3O43_24105 [Rhodococcus aetherivorans]
MVIAALLGQTKPFRASQSPTVVRGSETEPPVILLFVFEAVTGRRVHH